MFCRFKLCLSFLQSLCMHWKLKHRKASLKNRSPWMSCTTEIINKNNLVITNCIAPYHTSGQLIPGARLPNVPDIKALISNYNHGFPWDVIIHHCPEFNVRLAKPLPLKLGHGWVIAPILLRVCDNLTEMIQFKFAMINFILFHFATIFDTTQVTIYTIYMILQT